MLFPVLDRPAADRWQSCLARDEARRCHFEARFTRRDGSIGWLEGFYYRPRVDRELLSLEHDGALVPTGLVEVAVARSVTGALTPTVELFAGASRATLGAVPPLTLTESAALVETLPPLSVARAVSE